MFFQAVWLDLEVHKVPKYLTHFFPWIFHKSFSFGSLNGFELFYLISSLPVTPANPIKRREKAWQKLSSCGQLPSVIPPYIHVGTHTGSHTDTHPCVYVICSISLLHSCHPAGVGWASWVNGTTWGMDAGWDVMATFRGPECPWAFGVSPRRALVPKDAHLHRASSLHRKEHRSSFSSSFSYL